MNTRMWILLGLVGACGGSSGEGESESESESEAEAESESESESESEGECEGAVGDDCSELSDCGGEGVLVCKCGFCDECEVDSNDCAEHPFGSVCRANEVGGNICGCDDETACATAEQGAACIDGFCGCNDSKDCSVDYECGGKNICVPGKDSP